MVMEEDNVVKAYMNHVERKVDEAQNDQQELVWGIEDTN